MKAKKYCIGILSLFVSISCTAKSSILHGPTSEKPYTVFKDEETGMVYAVQEHLVGKLGGVGILGNDRIAFGFTGLVKIYVSTQQSGKKAVDKRGITLEYGVTELFVIIDWDNRKRFSWPIGDADFLSTLCRLSELEKSQETARIAIRLIQPMFAGNGGLVLIQGKLLAILE